VFNTFTYYKLNIAPCRYYGSLETDDLVIAGHNFNSGFEKLKQLKKKDTVLFTNMNGETYSYRVEDTEMLKPEQVTDMVQSSYDLSLYTCNYSGSERFTVRCRITD
jgi:sortase A